MKSSRYQTDGAAPSQHLPPAHVGDWAPAFSPDGRDIAFVRSISGSITDIFVVPIGVASGATEEAPALAPPRRVTFDNADVLGVDWEPDGRHLVFSSDRAGGHRAMARVDRRR